MYMYMYAAGITIRRTDPNVHRKASSWYRHSLVMFHVTNTTYPTCKASIGLPFISQMIKWYKTTETTNIESSGHFTSAQLY